MKVKVVNTGLGRRLPTSLYQRNSKIQCQLRRHSLQNQNLLPHCKCFCIGNELKMDNISTGGQQSPARRPNPARELRRSGPRRLVTFNSKSGPCAPAKCTEK